MGEANSRPHDPELTGPNELRRHELRRRIVEEIQAERRLGSASRIGVHDDAFRRELETGDGRMQVEERRCQRVQTLGSDRLAQRRCLDAGGGQRTPQLDLEPVTVADGCGHGGAAGLVCAARLHEVNEGVAYRQSDQRRYAAD